MGRKSRISTYQSSRLKKVKNIHTRRTRASVIQRDIVKGNSKRLKNK